MIRASNFLINVIALTDRYTLDAANVTQGNNSSLKVRSDTGCTSRSVAILFIQMVHPVCLARQDVRWMCLAPSSRKWLSS